MNRCFGCMKPIEANEKFCSKCGFNQSVHQDTNKYLKPGTKLNNRYIIGKVLGHGGFGITYIAFDEKLEQPMAIKEYLPNALAFRQEDGNIIANSEKNESYFKTFMDSFLDEAKVLAKFNNEAGIVSVQDYFSEYNTVYIVMNFLEGISLNEHLKKIEKMSFEEMIKFMIPIMRSLEKVHKVGIVHRDISPDNIILTKENEVKLIDFGAARDILENQQNQSIVLKKGYAPIEQYSSNLPQGPWTDVYAVAATIYHLLTGKILKEPKDREKEDSFQLPSEMGVHITKSGEKALMKALSIESKDRYQSIEEFYKALIQGDEITTVMPKKKNFLLVTLPIVVIVGIGLFFGWKFLLEDNRLKDPIGSEEQDLKVVAGDLTYEMMNTSVYFNDSVNPIMNEVTIEPFSMKFKENQLIVDAYVVNGLSEEVSNIQVNQFIILNEKGEIIAQSEFGTIAELSIEKNSYKTQRFVFNQETIKKVDDDLNAIKYSYDLDYKSSNVIEAVADTSTVETTTTKSLNPNVYLSTDVSFELDKVAIYPVQVKYTENEMVVEAYLANGFLTSVYNIQISQIIIRNENGDLLGSGDYGTFEGGAIEGESYKVINFAFDKSKLGRLDDDLDQITCEAYITYDQVTFSEMNTNYYHNNDIIPKWDDVVIQPQDVRFIGNQLIADVYIINGNKFPVKSIQLNHIQIVNENNQVIAEGEFNTLTNSNIEAESYIVYSLTFNAPVIYKLDDDFDYINLISDFTFSQ